MVVAAFALAAVAAAFHVYVFYLESIAWTGPRARATFGTTAQQAEATRALALNQGYYNLFLVLEIVAGVAIYAAGQAAVGATLVFVGCGSMMLAALVLMVSDRSKARAAALQGVVPALAIVLLALGL